MESLWSLLLFAAVFFFMMRFGCGAHMNHGHGGHDRDRKGGHEEHKDPQQHSNRAA